MDKSQPPQNLEATRLLHELEIPTTTPVRRLEIGKKLAEIGDPVSVLIR
jgi:hypothetical protein